MVKDRFFINFKNFYLEIFINKKMILSNSFKELIKNMLLHRKKVISHQKASNMLKISAQKYISTIKFNYFNIMELYFFIYK